MMTKYLCLLIGEDCKMLRTFHRSTVERIQAFGLAIHIPIALWAVTSYVVATQIFDLSHESALIACFFCCLIIFLLERLILAVPKTWLVCVLRLGIGILVALLAASMFDLVIFKKEIASSLNSRAEKRITLEFEGRLARLDATVLLKKKDWRQAQEKANCEANGTCGSGKPSVGPIYREMARQAETLHQEYLSATQGYARLDEEREMALKQLYVKAQAEAGLLERMEALLEYVERKPHAQAFWGMLFALVLALEMVVVFTKSAFSGETVDDQIKRVREEASRLQAQRYLESLTNPAERARVMLDNGYARER